MTKTEMTILSCLLGSVAAVGPKMTMLVEPKPYSDLMDSRQHNAAKGLAARELAVVEENYPREGLFTCYSRFQWHEEQLRRKRAMADAAE